MDGELDKDTIEYLLSMGAIEYAFTDDNEKQVYRLLPEAKTIIPEIYERYEKNFNSTVFSLWHKDAIDIVFDNNGEPLLGLNKNSIDREFHSSLDKNEQEILNEIIFVIATLNDDDDTIVP
jgi:hypothetical protein